MDNARNLPVNWRASYRVAVVWVSFLATVVFRVRPWRAAGAVRARRRLLPATLTVGRWGKMLAVRLPAEAARAGRIRNGERVEVMDQDGEILIRKSMRRLAVDDLFRGKTPRAWREFCADACNWGPVRGREIVEG